MSELSNEVAKLTQATTELVEQGKGQQANLDSKVATATTKAQESASSAASALSDKNLAEQAKVEAQSEADRSQAAADNAVAVVSGGEASLTSEAGKIPMGDSEGKIDLSWLPAEMQGYNVFAQEQAVNNDKFAASGFVHMGKHISTESRQINQGLFTESGLVNALRLGRTKAGSGVGDSKKYAPELNIGGVVTSLDALLNTTGTYNTATVKFPEAPNGTVTYDSATGVITDYTKDVDPKYGDVAADVNEAVARAFEGKIHNGDFRLGDIHDNTGHFDITDGILTIPHVPEQTGAEYNTWISFGNSTEQDIDGSVDNWVEFDVIQAATGNGVRIRWGADYFGSYDIAANGVIGKQRVFIPANTNGFDGSTDAFRLFKYAGHGNAGDTIKIGSVRVYPATEEVVTERVDMYGFEAWLEEVTLANPYVYANGLVQSQAKSINGVSTARSNRPDTYYAVFDGDTTSVGKGVDIWNASDADRQAMLSDSDNNLDLINGKIYQWRVRQRTIAGAGNGDWGNLTTTISGSSNVSGALKFVKGSSTTLIVTAQGALNDLKNGKPFGSYSHAGYMSTSYNKTRGQPYGTGVFSSWGGTDHAVDNNCHFLVCGTVSRLNQGAYHPSFNPMGTMARWANDNSGSPANWVDPTLDGRKLTTVNNCFDYATIFNDQHKVIAQKGYAGVGANLAYNGRPDDRWSDGIYASGQGGVIDYRLSAWDKSSPEHKAQALTMVESGTYRGTEKLKFSKLEPTLPVTYSQVTMSSQFQYGDTNAEGSIAFTVDESLGTNAEHDIIFDAGNSDDVVYYVLKGDNGNTAVIRNKPELSTRSSTVRWPHEQTVIFYTVLDNTEELNSLFPIGTKVGLSVIRESETNLTVSGEFEVTEVIGDPANILANPDLKEGWLGVWNPTIPDGTSKDYVSTRKALGLAPLATYSNDDGVTWITTAIWGTTYDYVINGRPDYANPSARTYIVDYTAFAKQTKPSTNQPVFNGEAGVGSVFASAHFQVKLGATLVESVLGAVPTADNFPNAMSSAMLNIAMEPDASGKLNDYNQCLHTDLALPPTLMEGYAAVKTLTTQLNVNDQASMQFQYEELIYDGDWGDDGKVFITSTGDSTNTDTNGNTVRCGVHELAIPYGWIKNET